MKKVFYAFAAMTLVAMFGLSSCKKEEPASNPEMKKAQEMTIGSTYDLVVKNYTGEVTWSTSNAEVVSLDASVKATTIKLTAKAAGTATVTAVCGSTTLKCEVTVIAEVPVIPEPDAEHAKIAIYIPAGTECYGITFHGSISQDAWALADWEFEAVEGAENWYVAEVEINPEADSQGAVCYGKPCLYLEDGTISSNWSTQWTTGTIMAGDEVAAIGMGGEDNKVGFLKSGVVYFKVEGWQEVPCGQSTTVKFSIKVPACDVLETVAFIGNMTDWNDEAMEWNASTNYWEIEYDVQAGGQFKFRDIDQGWGNQIQSYNEETGEWKDFDNFVLTDADIAAGAWTMDFSDPAKYQWSNCAPPAPCNPAGTATITLVPGFPENVNVIGVAMLGKFNSWNLETAVEMTPDNGSYAGTFEAIECEAFKFVYKLEGMEAYDWAHASTDPDLTLPEDNVGNFVFDASNWQGLPDAE